MTRQRLYLIDGPNIAFRAHYSVRGLTNSKGEATGALFGFLSMLMKLLKDEKPDALAVIWDPRGKTFRDDIYPDYKGTRADMPDELRAQMPTFPKLCAALGIPFLEVPRYEADDVIGTLAVRFKADADIVIVSSDKDLMQLVDDPSVSMLDTMKDLRIGRAQVIERWGVPPGGIVDMLALMGDTSDNIPGVRGIGEKGAAQLLQAWGSVDAIFEHLSEVSGRNKKPLEADDARAQAELSRRLATIALDAPIDLSLDALALRFPPADRTAITELLQALEFQRFLPQLGGELKSVGIGGATLVDGPEALGALAAEIDAADTIALRVEADGTDAMRARPLGLAIHVAGRAYYAPCDGDLPTLDVLRAPLQRASLGIVGHDTKWDGIVLRRAGLSLPDPHGDTMLADYLVNPGKRGHDLPGLAVTWLGHKFAPREVEAGPLPPERAAGVAGEEAQAIALLDGKLRDALDAAELRPLYREVELPLVPVLARMEEAGVAIDTAMLAAQSAELAAQIIEAEARCKAIADEDFNVGSPKQLAEILFGKFGLEPQRKTKTGASTDSDVLEELSGLPEARGLPDAILLYRSLTKLKSTYVDALPTWKNPETGRVHTTFQQTVAATGRLSSHDPNLQNIPIRTPEGRRVRAAFVAKPGCVFLSADYSQVELRVLAHLCSGQGGFARAFADGQDVHRSTAGEVFNVHPSFVTDEMRRTAKAINFGLVYGQTAHGLAQALHIPRDDARKYIARYKAKYPEVEQYMKDREQEARKYGYVTTILGRRRRITDLTSSNFNQREAAKRLAINTPVQGSAADIIKVAMIRIDKMLRSEFPSVSLLLQVHDELLFEVPADAVDRVKPRVVETMEQAVGLAVPLRVDVGVGHTWDEAH